MRKVFDVSRTLHHDPRTMSREPRTIMQEQIERLQQALDEKGAGSVSSFFGLPVGSMDTDQLRVVIDWLAHELSKARKL